MHFYLHHKHATSIIKAYKVDIRQSKALDKSVNNASVTFLVDVKSFVIKETLRVKSIKLFG